MYIYLPTYLPIYLSIDLLPVADLIPQWKLTRKLSGPGQHVASSSGGPSVEHACRIAARLPGGLSGGLPGCQEACQEACQAVRRPVSRAARLSVELPGGQEACQEAEQARSSRHSSVFRSVSGSGTYRDLDPGRGQNYVSGKPWD